MGNGLNAPERDASRTALGVAALRAVHQLIDGEPKILDDPIAALLLDDDDGWQLLARVRERLLLSSGADRTHSLTSRVIRQLRETAGPLAAAAPQPRRRTQGLRCGRRVC